MNGIQHVYLPHGLPPLEIGKRTLVMGILNITPDSFSDGGRYADIEQAVARARQMVADGADLIDIGGESTRPGSTPVSLDEELQRVIPVVEALKEQIELPISIDTYKAEVARQAIDAGAHIINDIWGAKADPEMAKLVARTGVPIVLMHNRQDQNYKDLIADMMTDFQESITLILEAGGKREQIILDPGIGFAKNYEENLEVMRHLTRFQQLGFPQLLGVSRKSIVGKTLNLPVTERMEGSLATAVIGIQQGIEIVRVHDVKETVRAVHMADAILRGERYDG